MKTCVFSQASEDAQDTHRNTEASDNLDGSGSTSDGESVVPEERGGRSDEEWEYDKLDKLATKDTQVSKCMLSQD